MKTHSTKWTAVLLFIAAVVWHGQSARAETLAEALETPTWFWSDFGGDTWGVGSGLFNGSAGGSYAVWGPGQSGNLATSVNGPGLLTFHFASQENFDFKFLVDWNTAAVLPSLQSNFIPVAMSIPAGNHQLLWSCGSSAQWVGLDNISLVPVTLPTLAEALDTPGWNWESGGNNGEWSGELGSNSHDGTDAAMASLVGYPIGTGGNAWIQTTVNGPGRLSFYASAILHYGNFAYSIDGQYQTLYSGQYKTWYNEPWPRSIVMIGSGPHLVRWEVMTQGDPWGYPGHARARLDKVVFDPPGIPDIMQQPLSQTRNQGSNATFSASVFGAEPMTYQWRLHSNNIAAATNLTLTITNVQPNHGGTYSLLVSNSLGTTISSNAVLTVVVIAPSIIVNDGSVGFGQEGFGFNLSGVVGTTVIVEGSTNLSDWLPLQTNLLDGTPAYFTDPQWTNYSGRYYRLRSQ